MKVIFRKCKKLGDITAVFLDELADLKGNLSCYINVGQHGGCSPEWVYDDTTPATVLEYFDLLVELGKVGYIDLEVIERLPSINLTLRNVNRMQMELELAKAKR